MFIRAQNRSLKRSFRVSPLALSSRAGEMRQLLRRRPPGEHGEERGFNRSSVVRRQIRRSGPRRSTSRRPFSLWQPCRS